MIKLAKDSTIIETDATPQPAPTLTTAPLPATWSKRTLYIPSVSETKYQAYMLVTLRFLLPKAQLKNYTYRTSADLLDVFFSNTRGQSRPTSLNPHCSQY